MFSSLLQLESIWKPERTQDAVHCSDKAAHQECIMFFQNFLVWQKISSQHFNKIPAVWQFFTSKQASSVLRYQGQRCFRQGPKRLGHWLSPECSCIALWLELPLGPLRQDGLHQGCSSSCISLPVAYAQQWVSKPLCFVTRYQFISRLPLHEGFVFAKMISR